jgi:APA family basic amino acid/polyamine antiporter
MRNPGIVAAGFGGPRQALLAWLVGGLFVAIDAMSTVELGAAVPHAGGPYSLAARAFGPLVGFVVGFADWLQLATSTGFIAVAFGEWVHRLGLLPALTNGELAVVLVISCGAINWIGTRVGGTAQSVGSAVKALGLALLVAALWLAPATAAPLPTDFNSVITWSATVLAMKAIYGAYGGWHAAIYFSEEVHKPERNVARATFSGILLVTWLYLVVNAALLKVLPFSILAHSKLPVADAAVAIFGPANGRLVTCLAILSVATIVNLQIMEHARTGYAMARNGVLPPRLANVSKSGTPRASLFVALLATTTIIISAELLKGSLYEILLEIYAPFIILVFLILAIAAIRLRVVEPDLPRPWKMPAFPVPALLSIGINGMLLVLFARDNPTTSATAGGLLVGGVLLYVARRRHWKSLARNLRAADAAPSDHA